ncbi:MAG: CRTAC1 family protein, partial [Deltaproteobacteria bacterium]
MNRSASCGEAWFKEISAESGFNFRHDAEDDQSYFMPEIMGSGGAFLDFDGDGRLDVFLVNGRWSHGKEGARTRNSLFRQQPDGSFADVALPAGLADAAGYGVGVAAADIDNDGDVDLYVTAFGGDRLWVNQGDGTFADRTGTLESINERWGTAAAFFDYDRDGWLDLCVVNYLDYFPGSLCDDGSGRRDYCGPTSFSGTASKLYRNLGGEDNRGLRFADVTVATGIASRPGPGLGVSCRDFNHDGRPDIFVANDMSPNTLWIQQPDGTFRDEGMLRGAAVDRFGKAEASMGVAWGDYDGDGLDDLFITTLRGETNLLLLGRSGECFSDETPASGLGPPGLEFTWFGVVALDLENDGDLDLVIVNGRVKRAPPLKTARLNRFWNDYAEPSQIFLNDGGGHFADASREGGEFSARVEVMRALAYADIDNDGDFDLLVTTCAGPARLYRNDTPRKGSWLMLRAYDPALNRDAIGARIEVLVGSRRFHREVNPSSSYLASNDVRVHFGLGDVS